MKRVGCKEAVSSSAHRDESNCKSSRRARVHFRSDRFRGFGRVTLAMREAWNLLTYARAHTHTYTHAWRQSLLPFLRTEEGGGIYKTVFLFEKQHFAQHYIN